MSFEAAISRVAELDRLLSNSSAVRPSTSSDEFEHVLAEKLTPRRADAPPTSFQSAPGIPPWATYAGQPPIYGGVPAQFGYMPAFGVSPPLGATAVGGSSMLRGDLTGLDPQLAAGLERVARQLGQPLEIVSGHRSREEQSELYQRYLNGTGNLAAPPGSSHHETGRAADVYVNGTALASFDGGSAAASAAGLGFPVPGEPWHVELSG